MIWLFNAQQLIGMISIFDLADVAGRNNLLALIKELLLKKNVPHSLVEPLMKIHRLVQVNPQQQIQDIAEIISELRDPMKDDLKITEQDEDEEEPEAAAVVEGMSKAEKDRMVEGQQKKKVEMAKIKVKLNILKDDLDAAIRNKDFVKAQDFQLEMDELEEQLQNLNEELALMIVPRSACRGHMGGRLCGSGCWVQS